jgi:hypothetical protein
MPLASPTSCRRPSLSAGRAMIKPWCCQFSLLFSYEAGPPPAVVMTLSRLAIPKGFLPFLWQGQPVWRRAIRRPDKELRAERFFPTCTAPRTLTEPGELTGKPLARQAIRHVPAGGTCRCFAAGGQKSNRAEPYAARFTKVLQNFLSKSLPSWNRMLGKSATIKNGDCRYRNDG